LTVDGLVEACGVVDVKRVGSAGGERDIVDVGFGGREEMGRNWVGELGFGKIEMDGVAMMMPEVFRCCDVIGWMEL
jgi:hypothetical protein